MLLGTSIASGQKKPAAAPAKPAAAAKAPASSASKAGASKGPSTASKGPTTASHGPTTAGGAKGPTTASKAGPSTAGHTAAGGAAVRRLVARIVRRPARTVQRAAPGVQLQEIEAEDGRRPGSHTAHAANGSSVRTRADGKRADVHDSKRGMDIHHGLNGNRRVSAERADHSRVVSERGGRGYVAERRMAIAGTNTPGARITIMGGPTIAITTATPITEFTSTATHRDSIMRRHFTDGLIILGSRRSRMHGVLSAIRGTDFTAPISLRIRYIRARRYGWRII